MYHRDNYREYLGCLDCRLVFVPTEHYLSERDEKAEYDLHENGLYDPGYRRFLGRIFEPVNNRVGRKSRGLDFGCGPGPALSLMFEEAGHNMSLYDKFYQPDDSVLKKPYDFITATEVLEHIADPEGVLTLLWNLLVSGGVLGIMTKLVTSPEAFAGWHYTQDRTHICFYSRETFLWIAGFLGSDIEFIGRDVILLVKPS